MAQNIPGLEDIRRQLCLEPVKYAAGTWFRLLESDVMQKSSGRAFAKAKAEAGKPGRRVILYENATNPNTGGYPRTSQKQSGSKAINHDSHSDVHSQGTNCGLNKDGTVLLIPVVVPLDALNEDSFSCVEPEDSDLFQKVMNSS